MSQMRSKYCPKCEVIKDHSEFPFRLGTKDGLRNRCKVCTQNYQAKHKLSRKDFYDKYWRDYRRNRMKVDINFKLSSVLRRTISRAVFRKRAGSAVTDLGCSLEELKNYLQSKFQPGMTWENHGDWHIDHIFPLSKLDLTKRNDFLKACHYTNLQPLWARDNIIKSNRS